MNRKFATILIVTSILTACSETRPTAGLEWEKLDAPTTSGAIIDAIALSDAQGNVNLIWLSRQEQTPEADVDTTSVDDTDLKCAKTDLFFQRYSASSKSWGTSQTLQEGVLRVIEQKEFKKDSDGNATSEFSWRSVNAPLSAALKVGADSSGNLMAAWIQDTASDCAANNDLLPSIYYASYSSDAWSDPALLVSSPSNHVREIDLSVNSNGQAIIAWTEWDSSNLTSLVYGSHFDGLETWTTPTQISGNDSRQPRTKISDNDNGVAVWRQIENGFYSIKRRNYDSTDQWAASIVDISSSSKNINDFTFGLDSSETSWIAWIETSLSSADVISSNTSSQNDIYVINVASDDTVGTATNIQADIEATTEDERTQNAGKPQISISADGQVTVSWLQQQDNDPMNNKWNNSANASLWVNRFDGSSWLGAQPLVNDSRISVVSASLFENAGETVITWVQDNDSREDKAQAVYNASFSGSSWSDAALVDEVEGQVNSFSVSGIKPVSVISKSTRGIVENTPVTEYAIEANLSK